MSESSAGWFDLRVAEDFTIRLHARVGEPRPYLSKIKLDLNIIINIIDINFNISDIGVP